MADLDARWLLYPAEPAWFHSTHLDRRFFHLDRGRPGYYGEVFSRARLAQVIDRPPGELSELVYASAEGVMDYLPVRSNPRPRPRAAKH